MLLTTNVLNGESSAILEVISTMVSFDGRLLRDAYGVLLFSERQSICYWWQPQQTEDGTMEVSFLIDQNEVVNFDPSKFFFHCFIDTIMLELLKEVAISI